MPAFPGSSVGGKLGGFNGRSEFSGNRGGGGWSGGGGGRGWYGGHGWYGGWNRYPYGYPPGWNWNWYSPYYYPYPTVFEPGFVSVLSSVAQPLTEVIVEQPRVFYDINTPSYF